MDQRLQDKKNEMVPHFLTCDQGSNTPPNQTLVINSGFNFLTIFYIPFFFQIPQEKIPCPQKKNFHTRAPRLRDKTTIDGTISGGGKRVAKR